MIMPVGAGSFKEAMQIGCEIYQSLKKVTKKRYGQDAVNVGDEGGFAPPIKNNEEGVELVMEAIHSHPGYDKKVVVAMDVASSEFYVNGKYDLAKKTRSAGSKEPTLSGEELGQYYSNLIKKFPIVSIEDPFDQV
jgi:enolase